MSQLLPFITSNSQRNELFSLAVEHSENSTAITMQVFVSTLNTRDLPLTFRLLQKHLPSIFESTCFNENNYPFREEVKQTEIGHLFEHILLEYLSAIKTAQGIKNPWHNGLTQWNWREDTRGVFHITVDVGQQDAEIFARAFKKSILLTNKIMQSVLLETMRDRPLPQYNLLSE